jgi:hypothetical protein
VTRYLAFAGVVALTLLQPAVTLAAPPGGMAVYRPAPPPPPPIAASSRDRSRQDGFRVPFDVNVQAKPLPESRQSPLIKWSPDMGWGPAAYRRPWLAAPNLGYLWYQPASYQAACYLNNAFARPSASSTAPQDVTIGSLVDKNSENLFSLAPSHTSGLTSSDNSAATASSPPGLQYEFQATPCGSANVINF